MTDEQKEEGKQERARARVRVRLTNMDSGAQAGWFDTTQGLANQLVTSYSEWRQDEQRFIVEVQDADV